MDASLRRWANGLRLPEVLRIGYFGSYAWGEWGVGSDLDVVIVLERSDADFLERARSWDLGELPVPADVLVYTASELTALLEAGGRFAKTLREETVWIYERPPQRE